MQLTVDRSVVCSTGVEYVRWPLLGVLVLLVLSTTALAGTEEPNSQLRTQDPVAVAGSVELTTGSGAVHVASQDLPSLFTLEASQVSLEFEWKTGTSAGPPGSEERFGVRGDDGQTNEQFSAATVMLEATEGSPELLAYADEENLSVQATGTGDMVYDRFEEPYITQVGASPSAQGSGDERRVGFWYEVEPHNLVGQRLDHVSVEGNFSVFINNARVSIREDGQTVWRNWTGYREESTGPAARSYERHLLLLHVTNGTLSIAENDHVTVLGPVLDIEASGVVATGTAQGRLQIQDAAFRFDEEPLQMEGQGSLKITDTSSLAADEMMLAVDEGSGFDIHGGERIETGVHEANGVHGWRILAPVALLAVVGVGAIGHRTGVAREAVHRWRFTRYSKWMTRGRELADAADYGQAARCFRRATRAQPAEGVGWFHLALALLESDQLDEVLDVIDQVREGEAFIDELDFLVIEAEASRQLGEVDRCRDAVAQLAEGSQAMARTLVHDLDVGEEVLGSELAGRLSLDGDEEGLQGYA